MNFNKNIPEIEKKIGYTFKDKSLLRQAFTRSSYCNEHKVREKYISNEVLEFFGDSVLSTAIVSLMTKEKTRRYEHGIYTELDEGDFSNIRSKLSDKRNLSLSMQRLGLQRHLLMGEGDSKLGVENEPSVMEDLFESIIGAIYIDCGMDMSRVIKVVSGMLDVSVYFSGRTEVIQSYKNALQEWCADKKRRLPAPIYITVSESGPDHKRIFERAVKIGERIVAVGTGKNQKAADSAAAEAALDILKSEDKTTCEARIEALGELRAYAAKNKQPSPEFRDLGESARSNANLREYIIECRFMGKSVTATAQSKQQARAIAASKMLAELKKADAAKARTAIKPSAPTRTKRKLSVAKKPSSAKKSEKAASPKKTPHQHKKHL